MEHAETVLKLFAQHTQQSPKEMENVSQLAQKYIAVHSRLAPPALVYPFIASDFTLLSLRTHTPPLVSYSSEQMVDIPTFVYISKHGFPNRPLTEEERLAFPSLAHFEDNLMPRPVGEEEWIDYERTDHWKKRALFLGLNFREMPQIHRLAEAVYGEGGRPDLNARHEKEAFNAFFSKYIQFQPYKIDAKEMGRMIQQLDLTKTGMNVLERVTCSSNSKEEEEEEEEKKTGLFQATAKEPIVFVSAENTNNVSAESWDEIRKEESIQDYRRRAGLNVTFSPQKMVKQMILSSVGVTAEEVRQLENVDTANVFPHSKKMEAFPPVEQTAWPLLMNAMDSFDMKQHSLDPASSAIVDLNLEGKVDPKETLKTILTLYHPEVDLPLEPRIKMGYMKKHPQMDKSIIKTLIEL